MLSSEAKKRVAYLFGAGASHAELTNLDPHLAEEKRGLLIGNVSSRVIEIARRDRKYRRDVEMVSGVGGSLNIELLISLIENSKIDNWADKTSYLKKLVEKDIKTILSASRPNRFYLHRGLFELHAHGRTRAKEQLVGLISLNYDDILDRAYEAMLKETPNYCLSLDANAAIPKRSIPLLKLHGSFNWNRQKIRGRTRRIEIIPLGASKSYFHAPYSFIWNHALETLIGCDTLRVVGCSLSPNDTHLIDLLFKAHLEKGEPLEIEIIASDSIGEEIRKNYGFFPKIKTWKQLEGGSIPEPNPSNPFKVWLKYKGLATLGERSIKRMRYLTKVVR